MKKEILIVIIIIFFIIITNIITQTYTKKFFDSISEDLSNIEEKMLNENSNKKEIEEDIKNVITRWRNKYDFFAYFLEHDELEKVETQLISIKANSKVDDFDKCVDEIEKCKFIIKHIEDKDSLKIVNIF